MSTAVKVPLFGIEPSATVIPVTSVFMADPLNEAVAAVAGQPAASSAPLRRQWPRGQAAAQNIAAAPSLDALAEFISGINQKAYLSAPGRQAQEVISRTNWLATSTRRPFSPRNWRLRSVRRRGLRRGQRRVAERDPAGDWHSRQALSGKGATDLNALYSGMPVTDASQFAFTPALLAQQQEAAAQLAEQAREFNIGTAEGPAIHRAVWSNGNLRPRKQRPQRVRHRPNNSASMT